MARTHRSPAPGVRPESNSFWSLVADVLQVFGNLLHPAALVVLLAATLLVPARSAGAAGGGNDDLPYGLYTCVDGYVWREAVPNDYVCVEPWMRDQAAADNAMARHRIDHEGAYGPNSCVQGYVWREVTPHDLVCVEPWVRDQVAHDNAHAEERWVSEAASFDGLFGGQATVDYGASANDGRQRTGQAQQAGPRIWTSIYYHDPVADCWYDAEAGEQVCRSSSVADIPRIQVNGDGFVLYGDVTVGVFVPGTDELVARYDVSAGYHEGYEAGSFGAETGFFDCTGRSGVTYEIQAYDWTTEEWSNTLTVTACTNVL